MTRTLDELQRAVGAWSDKQFPGQPTQGKVHHLIKEANELAKTPNDTEEMADCLILLLEIARRASVTGNGLINAGFAKLEICKRRQWGPPDANGTCEHIR